MQYPSTNTRVRNRILAKWLVTLQNDTQMRPMVPELCKASTQYCLQHRFASSELWGEMCTTFPELPNSERNSWGDSELIPPHFWDRQIACSPPCQDMSHREHQRATTPLRWWCLGKQQLNQGWNGPQSPSPQPLPSQACTTYQNGAVQRSMGLVIETWAWSPTLTSYDLGQVTSILQTMVCSSAKIGYKNST